MKNFDIKTAIKENAEYTERVLERYLSKESIGDGALADAMRYATLGGGKRIRAYLVMKTGEMFGATPEMCAPFAAAIEMIHASSLVHDDLPAMDNDDMRRGQPSCHKAFGEAIALLAGDALLSLAFRISAENPHVDPRSAAKVTAEYGRLSGVLGMAGGQEIDLAGNAGSYEKLCDMYRMKTGALICASLFAGYYAAVTAPDGNVLCGLEKYGMYLGLSFQIQDDLLDVLGDESVLGKPVGSDDKNEKHTVLSYMSIEDATKEQKRLSDEAVAAVSEFPRNEALSALVYYLTIRKS